MANTSFTIVEQSTAMKAANDSILIGCNGRGTTTYILDNDSALCRIPAVRILTQPSLSGITISEWNGYNITATTTEENYILHQGKKDSIQYEIDCSVVKDTAWVYISLNEPIQITNVTASAEEVYIETNAKKITGTINRYWFNLYSEDFSTDFYTSTMEPFHTFENLTLSDGKYYVDVCTLTLSTACCATDSFEIKNGTGCPRECD